MSSKLAIAASALVFAACSGGTPTSPTQPALRLKVDPGTANSGTYTCRKDGSPTVNKVTADNKQYWVSQGYTCTKN